MTEKEKRANSMLYDANNNKELLNELSACKDLCFQFNYKFLPSQIEEGAEILKKIIGKLGENAFIQSPFWCDFGYNTEIGDNFYATHNLVILDGAKVKIVNNVFIAPDCGLYTAGHPFDAERRNKGYEYAYPITIGSNVWIGAGTRVMPGVTIGNNVTIGAGSVVTKDIPDNVLAVGNPCRVLRELTEEDLHRNWDRKSKA